MIMYYNSPYYQRVNTAVRVQAYIKGGPLAPAINGIVTFTDVMGGTMVCVSVSGLPPFQPAANGKPQVGPHGFHIHNNGNCDVGDQNDPFMAAGEHWNPTGQPHGNHIIWETKLFYVCPLTYTVYATCCLVHSQLCL